MEISHTGSLSLKFHKKFFRFLDTLCVPYLCKNLISVHHLIKHNNVLVELHPLYFLVKDKHTWVILLRGTCSNGVYTFPKPMVSSSLKDIAYVHERTSTDGWHKHLGHPSPKIVAHLVKFFSLLVSSSKLSSLCNSCSINKAHQLSFRPNSLTSQAPLDLVCTDVWGHASSTGIDGSRYYLIFVDHFSKYIWFYPMVKKSDVSTIFPKFKNFTETRFQTKIKSLYSNNGGEFITLRSFLSYSGISHYTTAPHTPQQNGVAERCHRHLVETGLTLLHDASLDLSYWPHAFHTASNFINRHPTPLLQNCSPCEYLFGQLPNYLKLRKFGCLCYPLTRPYNTNKLQPKSRPCVFLGYSQTQNAYKCRDATINRLILSRHVLFDENRHVPPIPPDVSSQSLLPSFSSLFVKIPCSPSITMPSHQSPSSTQEGDTTIAASSSGNISIP